MSVHGSHAGAARAAAGALVAWGVVACSEPLPLGRQACTLTAECASGYHCAPDGVCRGDVACGADADCCLAERCLDQRCRPRQVCTVTAPCADPGAVCMASLCVPRPCGADTPPCPAGRACVLGRCVLGLPCDGHCPPGSACARLVDRCVPAATAQGCKPGELQIFSQEPGLLREGCGDRDQATACAALPSLPAGDVGLPAAAVLGGGKVHVVAYDATYGDVVVTRHAGGPPFAKVDTAVIAGVPTDAPVVGDPSGPRGGIAATGPHVGRVLDAAADGKGRVWAIWRDDTAGGVGGARIDADGTRTRFSVTAEPGVGEALGLAVLPDGRPVVAGFAPASAGSAAAASRLTLHVASTDAPTVPSDWATALLASDPAPSVPLPCGGTCTAQQVCVAVAGAATCLARAQTCSPCLPSQVCAAAACRTPLVGPAPLAVIPAGRGSWLDVAAFADGSVAVAAYRASSGDVVVWTGKPGTPLQPTLVPRQAIPDKPPDFGRFVRVLENPVGRWTLACEDTTNGRLVLVRDAATGITASVIDDGVRSDGRHRVGADVGMARHASGALLLAYQDARRGDLWTARVAKPGALPVRTQIALEGAHGFSAHVLGADAKAWIVVATRVLADKDGHIRPTVELRDVVWSGE